MTRIGKDVSERLDIVPSPLSLADCTKLTP